MLKIVDFFIHFVKNLKKTGAVAPSSKFLARDLVEPLENLLAHNEEATPFNILELGPGTGPLTNEIVKILRPDDHLDLVEVQEKFFKIVSKKYRGKNISVHFRDFLKFEPEKRYKFIFSSLPYDNMARPVIRKIWQKKLSLCTKDAYICYIKYIKFRKFKSEFEEEIVNTYKQDKKLILRNLPPANVYTLQINQNPSMQKSISGSRHL